MSSADLHVEVWPINGGRLLFPQLDGLDSDAAAEAVATQAASGSAVGLSDPAVRDALLARGAVQVRHVLTMRREVVPVPSEPAPPGLELREWRDGDAELLAPALIAAYHAEHPDAETPDLGHATASLQGMAEDPDNPRLRATSVAELDGHVVGAALVLRSEHVTAWKGPWVMNVFRAPDPRVPGVGRAMLVRALGVLRDDGESHVGLAVTATNPARRVYERLGFAYDFEGWVVVLP